MARQSHLVEGIARPSWDEMHMYSAFVAAARASCLKRAVGAVLVRDKRIIASGYNGAPEGADNCLDMGHCYYEGLADKESSLIRPLDELKEEYKRYCLATHAEANALGQCSKLGIEARGAVLYVTNFPCPGCVRDHILTNKLSGVYYARDYISDPSRGIDEKRESERLLRGAKIPFDQFSLSRKRMVEIQSIILAVGERTSYEYRTGDADRL